MIVLIVIIVQFNLVGDRPCGKLKFGKKLGVGGRLGVGVCLFYGKTQVIELMSDVIIEITVTNESQENVQFSSLFSSLGFHIIAVDRPIAGIIQPNDRRRSLGLFPYDR